MRTKTPSADSLRLSQNLFVIAYLIFVTKHMFAASRIIPWPGLIDDLTNVAFMCVVGAKLMLQRYTNVQLLGIGIVTALCVYSSMKAHYFSPMLSLMLVIALQDVDLRSAIHISYLCKTAIILFHVVCYIGLAIFDPGNIQYLFRDGVARHFFLLGHPNLFSTYVVWTCLEFVYLNFERLHKWHIGFIMLINVVLYLFTGSRTGMYISVIISVFLFFKNGSPRPIRAIVNFFAKYGFGLFSALCVFLTAAYTPSLSGSAKDLWLTLNEMLTGRLVFGAYAYHNFGLTWLGRLLKIPEKVYYNGHWLDGVIFDNAYQWMMLVYGAVFLVIIGLAFFLISKRMEYVEKMLVFAYILYALMENYIVNAVVCFPLLFIGKYLYEKRLKPEETPVTTKEETIPLWKRGLV